MQTIFSFPQYLTFPKRDEALRSIWELVHSWIRKNGMYRNQVRTYVLDVLSDCLNQHLSFNSTSSAQSMWSSFICPLSTDQRRSCGISTRCRGPSGASTSTQGSSTTTSVRMTSVIAQMLIQVTHDHECKFSIEYHSHHTQSL